MSFSIIACVGKKLELGRDNGLIFHIKDDMRFFRETTLNHKVIMGYRTWLSLGERPLKNRENLVVSRHDRTFPPGVVQIHDLDRYIAETSDSPEEIFVIGGANLYSQLLPFIKSLYLTEVDAEEKSADVFFPKFDRSKFSATVLKSTSDPETGLNYKIIKYERN